MLNSYSNSNNYLNINAVSGTLVKNHKKSKFIYASGDSEVFDKYNPTVRNIPVIVLQAMIVADGMFLCEVVKMSDFYESERED